jgi:hypothetical protein
MTAISNKHPELLCHLTWNDDFGVKPYVVGVKEVIEMVK